MKDNLKFWILAAALLFFCILSGFLEGCESLWAAARGSRPASDREK